LEAKKDKEEFDYELLQAAIEACFLANYVAR
jgi:hypothetical protein